METTDLYMAEANWKSIYRFLAYLIAALQTLTPGVGAGVLTALHAPQPPPHDMLLTALLNDSASGWVWRASCYFNGRITGRCRAMEHGLSRPNCGNPFANHPVCLCQFLPTSRRLS